MEMWLLSSELALLLLLLIDKYCSSVLSSSLLELFWWDNPYINHIINTLSWTRPCSLIISLLRREPSGGNRPPYVIGRLQLYRVSELLGKKHFLDHHLNYVICIIRDLPHQRTLLRLRRCYSCTVLEQHRCCLWYRQVWCWYFLHGCHEPWSCD